MTTTRSPRTEPRKHGYSFREGVTMMAANGCGIDPYLAAEAGEDAKLSLRALRHALTLPQGPERREALATAARELRNIDPGRHGELVTAIAAKIAEAEGRRGGGRTGARTNPTTGQQEFADLPTKWLIYPEGDYPGANGTVTPDGRYVPPQPPSIDPSNTEISPISFPAPTKPTPQPPGSRPADWKNLYDPFGIWARAGLFKPLPIGRIVPPSEDAVIPTLINIRQNLLPPGWTPPQEDPTRPPAYRNSNENSYFVPRPLTDLSASEAIKQFIRDHEKTRHNTYDDGFGNVTGGIGHNFGPISEGNPIGRELSDDEISTLFAADIKAAEDRVRGRVKST